MYLDNDYQVTVVLNRKHDLGRLMNCLAHLAFGLCADLTEEQTQILDYIDVADKRVARISRWPIIVLSARNGNQLSSLASIAKDEGLVVNSFVDTMIGASAEEQLEATRSVEELELIGIALFGRSVELRPLTKKFSLFR